MGTENSAEPLKTSVFMRFSHVLGRSKFGTILPVLVRKNHVWRHTETHRETHLFTECLVFLNFRIPQGGILGIRGYGMLDRGVSDFRYN